MASNTTQTLPVKGMHCASCANIIKRNLSKIDGVEKAESYYGTEEAVITYDDKKTSVDAMNQKLKPFLYSVAKDPSFISFCQNSASGTSNSHKRVNPTVMMRYQIAYNQAVCELFGKHVEASIKKMMVNNLETKQLTTLRNWLLPMLMNGQVTVK